MTLTSNIGVFHLNISVIRGWKYCSQHWNQPQTVSVWDGRGVHVDWGGIQWGGSGRRKGEVTSATAVWLTDNNTHVPADLTATEVPKTPSCPVLPPAVMFVSSTFLKERYLSYLTENRRWWRLDTHRKVLFGVQTTVCVCVCEGDKRQVLVALHTWLCVCVCVCVCRTAT